MSLRGHLVRQRKWLLSIFLFVFVILLDQGTKQIVLSTFSLGETRIVFLSTFLSFFFTLVMNKGAAWGIGSLFPYFLFFLRILILMVLLFLWRRMQKRTSYLFLALIIGGAVSNMIDSCHLGAVVDFIHLRFGSYDYPVFNMADIAICLGTGGCIFSYSFQSNKENKG